MDASFLRYPLPYIRQYIQADKNVLEHVKPATFKSRDWLTIQQAQELIYILAHSFKTNLFYYHS